MDYKTRGDYENFGNYNYGAVGSAIGLSGETLKRVAGLIQIATNIANQVIRSAVMFGAAQSGAPPPFSYQRALKPWIGEGWPFGNSPYGDDSADQVEISAGINYFRLFMLGCQ